MDDEGIGRYNDHENVYDYVEFRMHTLIDSTVKAGRSDVADVMSSMLDSYLLYQLDIIFVSGWPFTVNVIEEKDNVVITES